MKKRKRKERVGHLKKKKRIGIEVERKKRKERWICFYLQVAMASFKKNIKNDSH